MNVIDQILDENYTDNIILYSEQGVATEFVQIAVIPLEGRVFAILQPLDDPNLAEDEALVFELILNDDPYLEVCTEDAMVDAVFDAYYELLGTTDDE